MAHIDIVIIIIATWGAYRGWKNGFLKEIFSTLGFLFGLFIAYLLYDRFGDFLSFYISDNITTGKIAGRFIAFIFLWIIVPIILGFLATLVTKTLKELRLGFWNSLTGSLVGIIKYVILLSFIFAAMSFLGILDKDKREQSVCYQIVTSLANRTFEKSKWNHKTALPDEDETLDTVWIPIHHK